MDTFVNFSHCQSRSIKIIMIFVPFMRRYNVFHLTNNARGAFIVVETTGEALVIQQSGFWFPQCALFSDELSSLDLDWSCQSATWQKTTEAQLIQWFEYIKLELSVRFPNVLIAFVIQRSVFCYIFWLVRKRQPKPGHTNVEILVLKPRSDWICHARDPRYIHS